MSTFLTDGSDVIVNPDVASVSRNTGQDGTIMMTTFANVTCAVEGQYVCRHDNGQSDDANIAVKSKFFYLLNYPLCTYDAREMIRVLISVGKLSQLSITKFKVFTQQNNVNQD